ncbi:MAG: hypothetical protein GY930_00805 [bacterium]|nr:hypothetical protein [bacterium]
MNNKEKTKQEGLPMKTEEFSSWQDPESGEWMVLTSKGSPFTDGVLNEAPGGGEVADDVGKPRRICDRCATRNSKWTMPRLAASSVV